MGSESDVLLELAWRRISECWNDKRDIETKASLLLGASGAVISIIVNAWEKLNPVFAGIGLALMLCAVLSCVLSLRIKKFRSVGILEMWESLSDEEFNDLDRLKLSVYSTLGDIEKENRKLLNEAAGFFSLATKFFAIANILITLSLFL
ncbi:MAG: hypothetical protein QXV61_00010 [Archaeoglobaceae archaeon]